MMNCLFFILVLSLVRAQQTSAPSLSASAPGSSKGNKGCECIDTTPVLELMSDCVAETNSIGPNVDIFGTRGVSVNDLCYPLSYGANYCATYDMFDIHPVCQGTDPPAFCSSAWCYINATECHNSEEHYYKTKLFAEKISSTDESIDLYYSFSTCNSSEAAEESWSAFSTTRPLSERPLVAVIPGIVQGDHFKLDSNGELVDWDSPEAFDNSIPWQGWVVDYVKTVVNEFSNIPGISFIHRSRGSKSKAPTSSWTQAVTDVEAGIADIGVAAFWITTERLNLVPFTIPITNDKIYLWIEQPELDSGSIRESIEKLLSPFSDDLWRLLVGAIVLYAVISLFLSPERFRVWEPSPDDTVFVRVQNGALMLADSLNISFLEFLGGNVDYWTVSGEAQKILNIGFALTIFVAVAAYTANLAAFLTRANTSSYISNMEEAIEQNTPICTWSSLQSDVDAVYPLANWQFQDNDAKIFEAYDNGVCSAIARGYTEVPGSEILQEEFCSRNLVHLPVPVMEKAMALPANNELVGGLSYWIAEAARKGITVDSFLSRQRLQCPLKIEIGKQDSDGLGQLTPTNMALPFIVFLVCVVLSILWQIMENYREKRKAQKLPSGEFESQRVAGARNRQSVFNLRRKSAMQMAPPIPGVDACARTTKLDASYVSRATLTQKRHESFIALKGRNSWLDEQDQADRIAKLEDNMQLLITNQNDFIQSMKTEAAKKDGSFRHSFPQDSSWRDL